MKKTDLAYFAGIVDGEGSIVIHAQHQSKGKYSDRKRMTSYVLTVSVANTNEWIIRQLQFSFGGYVGITAHRNAYRRTCYEWNITSVRAMNFLIMLLPYLKIKKPQAEIGIKFQKNKTSRNLRWKRLANEDIANREATKILIQKLNNRGGKFDKENILEHSSNSGNMPKPKE
jgi:hypothetical protein